MYRAHIDLPDNTPLPLKMRFEAPMTHEDYKVFCQRNPNLRVELNDDGTINIWPPRIAFERIS